MDGNHFFESIYDGSGQRVAGCVGNEGRTSSVLGVTGRVLVPIDGCLE